jgi:aryl-alcohol dehydrogenase-like predicted oxidoreductase
MRYRKLGRTAIPVSEIGLGTWSIGGSVPLGGVPTGYGAVPESEALRGLARGLELGVSFFDTSDAYGLGRAERLLGRAVAERRGQVALATKAGWVPDGQERWVADLSPDHLRAAAHRSRQRLGVDQIDLFQLHAVPAEGDETERALDTLAELKREGVCRAVGASVGDEVEAGVRLVRTGRIDVVQVRYSVLHQAAATDLLDEALSRGVGVIASSPLAHGFLGGRVTRGTRFADDDWRSQFSAEDVAARVERVGAVRFLTGDGARPLVHAALQFVLAHPAVSAAIPGFRNPEQVEQCVAAMDARPLSDIEVARARELARPRAATPAP